MVVINFAHPLTQTQIEHIKQITGTTVTSVHSIPCQFDNQQPFMPQIKTVLAQVPLTPEEWQTLPLLINPPAYAPAASALIAELHGLMGYFPSMIRIRPINDQTPRQFEVAEIMDLQKVRDEARQNRY